MSSPTATRSPASAAAQPKVKCCRCDREFPAPDPAKKGAKPYSFNKETGEIYCKSGPKDGPSCRAGQLRKAVNDLYAIAPRERLFVMMDIRPGDWKERGWISAYTEDDRVMACILYQSWCWPVCMEHACWIDAEDEDIATETRYKLPIPFTQSDIAKKLNMKRPNVSRAARRLQQRGLLRVDEAGKLYPIAAPASLSIAERKALSFDVAVEGIGLDEYGGFEFLRAMPRAMRTGFLERYKCAPADIRTEMIQEVEAICTDFYEQLRDIRKGFSDLLKTWCTSAASLSPRSSNTPDSPHPEPPSSTEPSSSPEIYEDTLPSVGRSLSGVVDEAPDEHAIEAAGKGALAKLRRPRPFPTDRPMDDAAHPWNRTMRPWLESRFAKQIPGYPLEDKELRAILATIQNDVHLEQFQKAALAQKHPRGWKVFVRIARQCESLHGQYELSKQTDSSQPKPPESISERMARELDERLRKEEANGGS